MHYRIEITGVVAAGKTTLARVLGEHGACRPVLESFSSNPFYEAFYRDPSRYAFETEVTFLLQHYQAARDAGEMQSIVCDFSLELDAAYAVTTLANQERDTFFAVHQYVTDVLHRPTIIVALTCGAEEALRRIRARGRTAEQGITTKYLKTLQENIDRRLALAAAPVLTINSEHSNFVEPGPTREAVIRSLYLELAAVSLNA